MKKKFISVLLGTAMLSTMLAGCGNSNNAGNNAATSSPSASPSTEASEAPATEELAGGEKVDLYILQYKVEIHDALQAAVNKYMELHPNVNITLETVGGGDDIGVVYKSKAAAGQMPDIFNAIGPEECGTYMEYLEDLSDQPWVSHANAGMLDLNTIDGKVYGLPVSAEAFGLIYNKAIFEAAGIDASTLTSYDAIDSAFATLQAKIDAGELKDKFPDLKNVTAVQGAEKWVLGDHAVNVALAPEFNEDVFAVANAKELQFNFKDAYKAYMELQLKYSANKDDYKGAVAVDYSTAVKELLGLGQVAVIQQGNWIYGDVSSIDQEVADNLAFLPAPIKGYKEDSIITLVANYWCVNSQSDANKKLVAKDFLNWLYQSDEGKQIVVNEFGFLPVFDNYGDLAPADGLSRSILDFAAQGKAVSAVFKGTPGASWLQDVFGAKVQGFLTGDLTWDQVFDESAAEWAKMRQ
ncbi:ABC transporter substrate-binding protein [Cellulosilyticum lentocellum]|uniref:Extracellular solute-binding protein family 1 n=1 Tax=Cellulosilyticum lentocellum (strain ATCC 49066 / DSM 5427 / NCIMB 11756 / RHM5) TaxID=642492 RepID=F2JIQ1_CELLD|nr:ABC transporter substrate-binding protein [Cellulosilyticum lentocellum]ADZ85521.1 extracellular solute-binding protein family 1 [Cellulosilyticum lentocellum DSM 5427]